MKIAPERFASRRDTIAFILCVALSIAARVIPPETQDDIANAIQYVMAPALWLENEVRLTIERGGGQDGRFMVPASRHRVSADGRDRRPEARRVADASVGGAAFSPVGHPVDVCVGEDALPGQDGAICPTIVSTRMTKLAGSSVSEPAEYWTPPQ